MIIDLNHKYTLYRDFNGLPLENGYIYIGEANRNPVEYPIDIYFDDDIQSLATQPVSISNGIVLNGSKQANIYVSEQPYSILIQNNLGKQIYYNKSKSDQYPPLSNQNLIVNGDFQLFDIYFQSAQYNDQTNINRWSIFTETSSTRSRYQYIYTNAEIGDFNNIKNYLISGVTSSPTAIDADQYVKLTQFLDDIYSYNSTVLTLSFRAKTSDNATGRTIAVSFDTILSNTIDKTSISPKIFDLTETWQTYTHTIDIPSYSASDGIEPYPVDEENALLINFWLLSGSDFGGQTNFFDEKLRAYLPQIADVKLEFGNRATDFKRDYISRYQILHDRIFETTSRLGTSYPRGPGYIVYVSPGIQPFIPGFRFKSTKRSYTSSSVKIFSEDSGDEGYVYLDGVGDIEVTSVAGIGYNGCSMINLASNTAAGNVYKYHYIVDDQYQL